MGQPITVTDGICFAFPDICLTPVGSAMVPIPYPNVASLAEADRVSPDVVAAGKAVITTDSIIMDSSGDEAGTGGGTTSGINGGSCTFTAGSSTVLVNGHPVVRLGDPTMQNDSNASGTVLGGEPTVLVGG